MVVGTFALAASMPVAAQQAIPSMSPGHNPVPWYEVTTAAEKHLVESGSKIVTRFLSASGMLAVVADNGKEQRLFYIPQDGSHLIIGAVFEVSGHNDTNDDLRMISNKAAVTSSDSKSSLITRASRLAWIRDGKSSKVLYVIFDPNCPYCHGLYSTLRSEVMAGNVEVRWVPVSILTETGASSVAAVYARPDQDRGAALGQAFNHILAPAAVTPAVDKALAYNLLLLRDSETGADQGRVPVILYQQGDTVHVQEGVPDPGQLQAILASLPVSGSDR
jgi:thiol:disulfide interchange protein DsbG